MKRRNIFTSILLAGIFSASAALAQTPPWVTINNISYGGNGCPQGSVGKNVASDRTAFTLLFDDFIAEIGPGVSLRESRKSCQLTVDLTFPQGWSYTVASFDYRGYASLDHGISGSQVATYYFMGQRQEGRTNSNLRGAFDNSYRFTDTLGINAYVWSPCGVVRPMNIKTEVRLSSSNRNARGLMTLDSIDGVVTHKYGLRWRRCN